MDRSGHLKNGQLWFAPDNADALAELFDEIASDHFHPHPFDAEHARRIVDYRGKDVYRVLDIDGLLVAYGMLRGWDEGFEIPSLGLAIRESARGQGIGRVAMELLHAEAGLRGAQSVRLRVNSANTPARRLYESIGYEPAGRERGELVMVCQL